MVTSNNQGHKIVGGIKNQETRTHRKHRKRSNRQRWPTRKAQNCVQRKPVFQRRPSSTVRRHSSRTPSINRPFIPMILFRSVSLDRFEFQHCQESESIEVLYPSRSSCPSTQREQCSIFGRASGASIFIWYEVQQ